jgi:monovalent cation:H+ antiporter, CPA1 family
MFAAAASTAVMQNGSAAAIPPAMPAVVAGVLGVAVLLTMISLLVPLAKRWGQPFTVMIAALGAALGFVTLLEAQGFYSGVFLESLSKLDVSSDAFLYVFLPPLLFAGGLTVDVRRLMDDIGPVVLLAVIAVLVCMAAVGISLWWMTHATLGATLLTCLLLGAIVATTDTAAVLGIFRDIGAPGRLTTIVEGESLFNDAAAIALFVVLLGMITSHSEPDIVAGAYNFFYGLLGGLIWGYILARMYCWAIGQFRTGIVSEITLSVSLAYLTFVTAQNLLVVSGIIAVVVAAMTFATMGRTKLSPGAWETLLVTWRQLEFWATSLIFVLAAMKAPKIMTDGVTWAHILGVATVFFAALIARAAVLWGMLPILTASGLGQAISTSYKVVLCWGSLRGAVTVALALLVSETPGVPDDAKSFIFIIAMGYVFATLFLSAPTLRPLMKALRLDKLSPQERMVRNRVMALSRGRVRDQLVKVSDALGVAGHALPQAGQDEGGDVRGQMSHADLARAGLIIAANREAEMSLEYLRQGVVGSRIAERLRSEAGGILDGLRAAGPEGYIRAALRLQNPSFSFRGAMWLQRRLSWTGPLADEMADRFELLIVKHLMLGELVEFAKDKLTGLIGNVALVEVVDALSARREAVQSALAALDLQYSEYTQSMRRRFLERLSVSLEEAEYQSQLDQNLISNEVYEDLEEDRRRRKTAMEKRPELDLGLELAEMLMKVPMFAGLDKAQLGRLAQLLNTELAVPGQHVIHVGETGDRMFFIASGALEVKVGGRAVRKLERGDFVGEMALLTNQPRNADVIALAYTNVMALKRRDFDVFLREHPQLKARIEAEAAERLAQNLKAATH